MDRKTIEEKLNTYKQGEAQLRANLQATQGAIQAMEQLLDEIDKEESDDTAKGRKADTADK